MTGGFDVERNALRAYARAMVGAAGRIDDIRARTGQLELTQETFGKLPQSDELKADYDHQRKESGTDLADAVDTLYKIVDTLRETADAYQTQERKTTEGLEGGS